MAENFLYFTELLPMPVVDLKGRRIGRVKDAAMLPLIHASRIDRLLVGGADSWLAIRFDQVHTISLTLMQLDGKRIVQARLSATSRSASR